MRPRYIYPAFGFEGASDRELYRDTLFFEKERLWNPQKSEKVKGDAGFGPSRPPFVSPSTRSHWSERGHAVAGNVALRSPTCSLRELANDLSRSVAS